MRVMWIGLLALLPFTLAAQGFYALPPYHSLAPDLWVANYYFTPENKPLGRTAPELIAANIDSGHIMAANRAPDGGVSSKSPCTRSRRRHSTPLIAGR